MNNCVFYDAIFPATTESPAPPEYVRCAGDYVNEAQLYGYLKTIVKHGDDRRLLMSLVTRYSRLLDTDAHVADGYFDAAGKDIETREFSIYPATNLLHLPPFVENSIESVTMNGLLISPFAYTADENNCLTLRQSFVGNCCRNHSDAACAIPNLVENLSGFVGTIKVAARWGNGGIRHDVVEAVLSMVAQAYRRREPVQAAIAGVTEQPFDFERRTFAWKTIVKTETNKRRWREFGAA